jgi:uncharacterized membrane protein
MHPIGIHYFPVAWPVLLILFGLFVALVALLEFGILVHAYERMGIHPRYVLAILFCTLLGSYVNIPVAKLPPEQIVTQRIIDFFGIPYVVPAVEQSPGTIIAVNVGGALIPTALSIYLLAKNRLLVRGLIAVAVVAAVVHTLATPVRGIGISIPIFIPPLLAAGIAMLLAWRKAAPLAFIAGSLGTLIGADLLNLGHIQGLGAPVASIGGAGTFDGVFLSGIIAVLLSPLGPPPTRSAPIQTPPDTPAKIFHE